jgi:GNAT superfamily N-acetyltransferase
MASTSTDEKTIDNPVRRQEYRPPKPGVASTNAPDPMAGQEPSDMADELIVHKMPRGRRVELLRNGEAVSWVEVLYRRLRIGRAELTYGGLADVFTRKPHRRKGFSRRVLEHTLQTMIDDGLHLSVLFGIPDYYHRFGYRTTLSDYRTDVPGRTVVGLPVTMAARKIPPARHAETLALYDRDVRQRGFGTLRDRRGWPGYTRGVLWHRDTTVVGFYRGRRLAGYVAFDDDRDTVQVSEASADSPETARSMLAWLGRLCRKRVAETIQLHLPPNHALSLAGIELGAAFTRKTHVGGGGMMRILNLGSAVDALMPELVSRWAASPLAADGLDLTLATDLGPAEVAFGPRGAAAAVRRGRLKLPQDRLVQMAVGYLPAGEVARRSASPVPRKLAAALDVLFPMRWPHILQSNRF